jgi:hypothetical protein
MLRCALLIGLVLLPLTGALPIATPTDCGVYFYDEVPTGGSVDVNGVCADGGRALPRAATTDRVSIGWTPRDGVGADVHALVVSGAFHADVPLAILPACNVPTCHPFYRSGSFDFTGADGDAVSITILRGDAVVDAVTIRLSA